jgi:hypothetical protein
MPAFIMGFSFWFWAAPSFRFIEPVIWSLLAWVWLPPVAAFFSVFSSRIAPLDPKIFLIPLTSLTCIVVIAIERVVPFNITPEPVPTADTEVFETRSGLLVMIPLRNSFLWKSVIPGAIIPRENLRIRNGGLDSGFRLEGYTPTPDLVNLPKNDSY